jgi:hypothetical protein
MVLKRKKRSAAMLYWNQNIAAPFGSVHTERPKCHVTMKCRPCRPPIEATKEPATKAEVNKNTAKTKAEVNTAEQGDTANIKQNTTNTGFFKGRRVK